MYVNIIIIIICRFAILIGSGVMPRLKDLRYWNM